jgi:hypothetical protein
MKQLFREQYITRVSYYKTILEDLGIPTMIRNEYLTMSGITEIPIPEFFPALCVLNDDDHVEAVRIIREHLNAEQESDEEEIARASCGEINPGNFAICRSCGKPVSGETNAIQEPRAD